MNLTEFLLARIAEDESVFSGWSDGRDGRWVPMYADSFNGLDATHDGPMIHPQRVMAESAAKRKIVEICRAQAQYLDTPVDAVLVLRHLAAVYAEHADFQSSWST